MLFLLDWRGWEGYNWGDNVPVGLFIVCIYQGRSE